MASLMMTKELGKNHGLWAESEYATLLPQSSPEPQDAQKVRPARPQANRNRRRTLRGTLRISVSRERSWRAFSASC
jgi:hypothetical protein